MTTYVVITEHPPQLCQTSNRVCGQMYAEMGEKMAAIEHIEGFSVLAGPYITSDHRSFAIVEVAHYDILRQFVVRSGVVQWNGVTTLPVIDYATARAELDVVTPIFMTEGAG